MSRKCARVWVDDRRARGWPSRSFGESPPSDLQHQRRSSSPLHVRPYPASLVVDVSGRVSADGGGAQVVQTGPCS